MTSKIPHNSIKNIIARSLTTNLLENSSHQTSLYASKIPTTTTDQSFGSKTSRRFATIRGKRTWWDKINENPQKNFWKLLLAMIYTNFHWFHTICTNRWSCYYMQCCSSIVVWLIPIRRPVHDCIVVHWPKSFIIVFMCPYCYIHFVLH